MSVNKDLLFNSKPIKYLWLVLIVLFFSAPIFLHLDSKPLREWDEARNAINAFEMSQTGNFLVKTYNYQADLWETKPPFLVWCQTLGFKILGYNELAVRLPSAIATFVLCIFLVYWFFKYFNLSIIGFFISAVIITSSGYMHEHGSRTGDHDSIFICLTLLALLNIFQYFENFEKSTLYKFFLFFTLAIFTKSVMVFLIIPGLFIYSICANKFLLTIKNSRFWIGLSLSFAAISLFYFTREMSEPGYLEAVWHNELFPRYLNKSDRYQYNQTDFWYYYRELKNWQFTCWFPMIIPAFIICITCYRSVLRRLVIFISIQIILYFIIISKGSSNVWYDLILIPFLAIIIGMAIYKVFDLIHISLNLSSRNYTLIFIVLFTIIFYKPYLSIIQKNLNNDETSAQVMYGYAFKRIEKTSPKLKNFKVYKPLGYNYPLVFYKNIYNQTKGYNINNIDDQELANYKGYVLVLKEQLPDFNKIHLDYKISLNDPFYCLIEL